MSNTLKKSPAYTGKIKAILRRNNIFSIIVIVVFIILFMSLFSQSNHVQKSTSITTNGSLPKENTVVLQDTGFRPGTISIRVKEAVRWVNDSSANKASVNSDNYPDNKLYPELNLGIFQKGQTLVHIFNSPGTFTYHNQFNHDQKGTVIVR